MNYRNKANITLVVVLIAFVLITLARYLNGNNSTLQLLHFVLEAALVGGIADWFAVTAIFRKPFGFPYHTALIPRNREKVIGGVSAMVEKDLLSLGSIRHKLAAVRYDQLIINWLDQNPDARKSAEKWCAGYLQDLSQKLDPADIAGHLVGYAREHLAALDLPQELQKLANWVLETQQDDKLLDYLLDKATEIAARPETRSRIYTYLMEQQAEQTKGNLFKSIFAEILVSTDSLNLNEAADAIQTKLVETLSELKDVEHPTRSRIKEIIAEMLSKISTKTSVVEAVTAWKTDALERLPLQEILQNLLQTAIDTVTHSALPGKETLLTGWITRKLDAYWQRFKQNEALRMTLNGYLQQVITRVIEAEHHLIGGMVRDTLNGFTDDDLNNFVNDKAGEDLQWIRINGSVIGGIVGLVIFLLLHFGYDPLMLSR